MTSAVPSLFDTPEGSEVREIQADQEARNAAFLRHLRACVAFHWIGRTVTTDEVWQTMEANGLEIPAGASPNLLGSFFAGWDRATATGEVRRSSRKGAHGNLLRCWVIS